MRKLIVPLLSLSMVGGIPLLVGCDKTVSEEKKTTVSPNGDTSKSETVVKEKANGDVVKEHSSSTDNTHNP